MHTPGDDCRGKVSCNYGQVICVDKVQTTNKTHGEERRREEGWTREEEKEEREREREREREGEKGDMFALLRLFLASKLPQHMYIYHYAR